jgi:hypothetical protein
MKKILVLLLTLGLFSGCESKKDITHRCVLEEIDLTVINVVTISHDYATVKENYIDITALAEDEEEAKTTAEIFQANNPTAKITVDGDVIHIFIDYMDIGKTDTRKETIMEWVTLKKSEGYNCTQE